MICLNYCLVNAPSPPAAGNCGRPGLEQVAGKVFTVRVLLVFEKFLKELCKKEADLLIYEQCCVRLSKIYTLTVLCQDEGHCSILLRRNCSDTSSLKTEKM